MKMDFNCNSNFLVRALGRVYLRGDWGEPRVLWKGENVAKTITEITV